MGPKIAAGIAEWGGSAAPIRAFDAFKGLTLDLASSIFIGVDLGPSARRMNRAFEDMVAASMSRIRLRIPGLEFYRGLVGREFMLEFLRGMLEKKRADQGADMFSRLCRARTEEGDVFRDDDVLDHMIFVMMAAHDTTTSHADLADLRARRATPSGRSACARRAARSATRRRASTRSTGSRA